MMSDLENLDPKDLEKTQEGSSNESNSAESQTVPEEATSNEATVQAPKEEQQPAQVTPPTEAPVAKTPVAEAAVEKKEEKKPEISYEGWSPDQICTALEKLVNSEDAGGQSQKFSELRDAFNKKIAEITEEKKAQFLAEGGIENDFEYNPTIISKFNTLIGVFKEKAEVYRQQLEVEQTKNLDIRKGIIERLKNLYINPQPGVRVFKELHEIKEAWQHAGKVSRANYNTLKNDFYFHQSQFYKMLDLNKEYKEQLYKENLETRYHIIERAKELINEPIVRKALNELQFLHKMWREEGEPVDDEFRESTWEEFKTLSNKILERKSELFEKIEEEMSANLTRKNEIIAEIKNFIAPDKKGGHSYWQQAIKKVEALRAEFIKIGRVPKEASTQNWNEFKEVLREFNSHKNDFYKNLKEEQKENLEKKEELLKQALDNKDSEDFETGLAFFKKLQNDWKQIGHVPRGKSDKIWKQFQAACNQFFDNYRKRTGQDQESWKSNYTKKENLLQQLKAVKSGDSSLDEINRIKNEWNNTGKVPRDKMAINSQFNKLLRSKMKENDIKIYELDDEHLSDEHFSDKARRIKNQINELENEISNLENNMAFFNNADRNNPLLKSSFEKLDAKKDELEHLKVALHQMIESHEESEENAD